MTKNIIFSPDAERSGRIAAYLGFGDGDWIHATPSALDEFDFSGARVFAVESQDNALFMSMHIRMSESGAEVSVL
jgi:hypothetical protein